MITMELRKHIAESWDHGQRGTDIVLFRNGIGSGGCASSNEYVDVSIIFRRYLRKKHKWVEKTVKLGRTNRQQLRNLAADILKVMDT